MGFVELNNNVNQKATEVKREAGEKTNRLLGEGQKKLSKAV